MNSTAFHILTLPMEGNPFQTLLQGVELDAAGKGRLGNHLVLEGEEGLPLVRTTTAYSLAPCRFSLAHQQLAEDIGAAAQLAGLESDSPLAFNHALMEVYDSTYTKMGYHSDQALDLSPDSWIALFTCYEHPEALQPGHLRKLKVRDKLTQAEAEIVLTQGSVVLFSVATNTSHQHKIVLEPVRHQPAPATENRWLGITLRRSKTFLRRRDGIPHFADGHPLTLAEEAQKAEFLKLRGQENASMDFVYPVVRYTLSPGDLKEVVE